MVKTIDNDIGCDGTDGAHVPEFGVALADALELVTMASPDSRILVVGQTRATQSVVCEEAGRRGPQREGGSHRNRHV